MNLNWLGHLIAVIKTRDRLMMFMTTLDRLIISIKGSEQLIGSIRDLDWFIGLNNGYTGWYNQTIVSIKDLVCSTFPISRSYQLSGPINGLEREIVLIKWLDLRSSNAIQQTCDRIHYNS